MTSNELPPSGLYVMKGGTPMKEMLSIFPKGSRKLKGHVPVYFCAYNLPRAGHNEVETNLPSGIKQIN